MEDVSDKIKELLLQLDSLWNKTGFLEDIDEGEDPIAKLLEEVSEPILRRIRAADELRMQLEKLIETLKDKATIQSISLAISLQLCQPSIHLSLKDQVRDWEILIEEFQDKTEHRRKEIQELQKKLGELCKTLDEDKDEIFPEVDKPLYFTYKQEEMKIEDLSANRTKKYQDAIVEANNRIIALRESIIQVKNEIRTIWDDLNFSEEKRTKHPVDKFAGEENSFHFFSQKKQENYSMKKSLILLNNRKDELSKMYSRLTGAVKELMPKIYSLWNELQVPPKDPHRYKLWFELIHKKNPTVEEQENFLKKLQKPEYNTRFPLSCIEMCETEYARLVKLKEEQMKQLILAEREILVKLWDKLHFSEEQRLEFIPGHCEEYTQETLDAIREEIKRLKSLYTTMGALLKQIERREWIKSEMKRFEKTASDPNRFKGSSMRLLEEEKFRKVVAKEFPRLTNNLRKSLVKWQKEHGGEAFYYEGEPYLVTMNREEDNPNFDLLHLRLLTSKPGETSSSVSTPTIQAVAERKVKPATQPRPVDISSRHVNDSKSNRHNSVSRIANSRDSKSTTTPLRSTKPKPK